MESVKHIQHAKQCCPFMQLDGQRIHRSSHSCERTNTPVPCRRSPLFAGTHLDTLVPYVLGLRNKGRHEVRTVVMPILYRVLL